MNVFKNTPRENWEQLLQRPAIDYTSLKEKVDPIITAVRKNGDKAVRKFTLEFDKADLQLLEVSEHEKYFALNQIDAALFDAIKLAAENITSFHRKQLQPAEKTETNLGRRAPRGAPEPAKVGSRRRQ